MLVLCNVLIRSRPQKQADKSKLHFFEKEHSDFTIRTDKAGAHCFAIEMSQWIYHGTL